MRTFLLAVFFAVFLAVSAMAQDPSLKTLNLKSGDVTEEWVSVIKGEQFPALYLFYSPQKQAEFEKIVPYSEGQQFNLTINGIPAGPAGYMKFVGANAVIVLTENSHVALAMAKAVMPCSAKQPPMSVPGAHQWRLYAGEDDTAIIDIFPDHVNMSFRSTDKAKQAAQNWLFDQNAGKNLNVTWFGQPIGVISNPSSKEAGEIPVVSADKALLIVDLMVNPAYDAGT